MRSTFLKKPKHVLELYGEGPQNRQLLLARRLVERGVRFVQTWHGQGQPWGQPREHRFGASQCRQSM